MALVFIYIQIVVKRVHLYTAYYILPNAELMNIHIMFYGDRLCNTMWHAVWLRNERFDRRGGRSRLAVTGTSFARAHTYTFNITCTCNVYTFSPSWYYTMNFLVISWIPPNAKGRKKKISIGLPRFHLNNIILFIASIFGSIKTHRDCRYVVIPMHLQYTLYDTMSSMIYYSNIIYCIARQHGRNYNNTRSMRKIK